MPIRNPFAKRQTDEGLRPPLTIESGLRTPPGFERVDTVGSKASSALSIGSRRSQDNGEYKMSVVNDSGIYLPPSPTEDKASWPRRYLSRTSTDKRSESGDIEPFGISRESFDSYRRSFDISARSPIPTVDPFPTRRSMDSARFPRMPRQRLFERDFPTTATPEEAEGEGFEDVGLNDDKPQSQQQAPQHPKKRGFFSKFSDNNNNASQDNAQSPVASSPMTSRFSILPGRKRGQSGQGAELGHVRTETREREMTDVQPVQA